MGYRWTRGFSLVELLVVIAIVGVLAALLLPSLKSARELSWSLKCLSGLRQTGLAHQMYSDSNNQTMVATGYVNQGDGWYDRLVRTGYAQQTLFTRVGGCPYAPARYQLGDNNDVFYGHASPTKHSSYGINAAMVGNINYITKAWLISDWDGTSYTARGITAAKQHRYKRYTKWAQDIMLFHCSTVPNSTSYGFHGINVRYTLGAPVGNWVVEPNLSRYARHDGKALPMLFSDGHAEQITVDWWLTDRIREVRWKSLAAYNKTEYMNSGAYQNPDR